MVGGTYLVQFVEVVSEDGRVDCKPLGIEVAGSNVGCLLIDTTRKPSIFRGEYDYFAVSQISILIFQLPFTVTPSRRLDNRIQGTHGTKNDGKIDVHTSLDQLCGNNPA